MQKKNRKIFIATSLIILAIFILSGLAAAGFFWYLPHFRLEKLQSEYLLQHRNFIRTRGVQAGAFNKFVLQDVQLGNTARPIFTAPRAELFMKSDFFEKISELPIKELHLYDCQVKVETAKRKVYINGILLKDIINEIAKLPPAADGIPLNLEIYSKLCLIPKFFTN